MQYEQEHLLEKLSFKFYLRVKAITNLTFLLLVSVLCSYWVKYVLSRFHTSLEISGCLVPINEQLLMPNTSLHYYTLLCSGVSGVSGVAGKWQLGAGVEQ